jgi:dTDP-4-dehydrorhamnose reductase
MTNQVLATGLSGLVGSRIEELLASSFTFTDLSLATGVDITDSDAVEKHISQTSANTILHLAAKADVDGCEDDKIFGEEGQAWLVNVVGTENIVAAAKKTGKRVIYISTDFVFDGTKEFYEEEDLPNPVNWYGVTKYEGEKLILSSNINYTIVRIAYPYRSFFPGKKDFARKILEKLEKGEKLQAVTDHIFTPTFIDDIAAALKIVLGKNLPGIYHAVGSGSLTTYEAVETIEKIFSLKAEIEAVDRNSYFTTRGRAFRPFKLRLKNDKISNLGIDLRNFIDGIGEVKKQMEANL